MKVYVAGAWARSEEIGKKMRELEAMGITIAHDWTKHEKRYELNDKGEQVLRPNRPSEMAADAKKDVAAVKGCDVFIAILDDPKYAYRGSYTEMGTAFGSGKPVMIYDPLYSRERSLSTSYASTNCFYWTPGNQHFHDWGNLKNALTYCGG